MHKTAIVLLLGASSAFAQCPACECTALTVAPYLGLNGQVTKTGFKGLQTHNSIRPYLYGGLKLSPVWAIEAGLPLKAASSRPTKVVSSSVLPDGSQVQVARTLPPVSSRAIDLRAVARLPLDTLEEAHWVLGAGVSHLKVKQSQRGYPSISHGKLTPSVLAGVEVGTHDFLKLRLQASYTQPVHHRTNHLKARPHVALGAGLAWHL